MGQTGRSSLLTPLRRLQRIAYDLGARPLSLPEPVFRPIRLLFRKVTGDYLVIMNFTLKLDSADSLQLTTNGVYEPVQSVVMDELSPFGGTVVDVGAHIGYHTLHLSRKVGPSGTVFSLEPNPDLVAILRENLAINNAHNVRVIPRAAANRSGNRRLYLSPTNTGDGRLYDPDRSRTSVDVEAVSLDELLVSVPGPVNLVKIDVQGAEPEVFLGMRKLIEEKRVDAFCSEFWPFGLRRFGSSPAMFLSELTDAGFDLYRISEGARTVRAFDAPTLIAELDATSENYTTILGLRRGSNISTERLVKK